LAISLSLLCTIHCLVLPLALVILPSLAALPLADEAFDLWMVIAVIPVSAYALTMGCKKHKSYHQLLIGGIGLSLLLAAVFLDHDSLGENREKILTVSGAVMIAIGHILNYRLCQLQYRCECHE